jgi:hypothetical protein
MDVYAVLHWLTSEVAKLAGQAEAKVIHDAITTMERGGQPPQVVQPPAAPAAPAVDAGQAPPDTTAMLAEILAALKGTTPAAPAPAAPAAADGPAVDQGETPEA